VSLGLIILSSYRKHHWEQVQTRYHGRCEENHCPATRIEPVRQDCDLSIELNMALRQNLYWSQIALFLVAKQTGRSLER